MIERIQIISGDFAEALEGMSYESVGRLFMGLVAYANDKDPKIHLGECIPALTLYPVMKTHIERQEEYRTKMVANGKKGGAPIGNGNAKKTTQNNQKQPKTTKNNQKQAPSPSPCPSPSPYINKNTYGECANVKLTDDEYQKLKDKNLTHLIDELSLYIASKGDKYKSHYATILGWSRKREKESSPKVNQFTSGAKGADYDFEEILKRKVVN